MFTCPYTHKKDMAIRLRESSPRHLAAGNLAQSCCRWIHNQDTPSPSRRSCDTHGRALSQGSLREDSWVLRTAKRNCLWKASRLCPSLAAILYSTKCHSARKQFRKLPKFVRAKKHYKSVRRQVRGVEEPRHGIARSSVVGTTCATNNQDRSFELLIGVLNQNADKSHVLTTSFRDLFSNFLLRPLGKLLGQPLTFSRYSGASSLYWSSTRLCKASIRFSFCSCVTSCKTSARDFLSERTSVATF